VLFVVGAHGLAGWRARPRPPTSPGRRLAAVLVAAVLAASVAPSLVRWVKGPWPPPWFAASEPASGGEPSGQDEP
jgi:hypothetical protein